MSYYVVSPLRSIQTGNSFLYGREQDEQAREDVDLLTIIVDSNTFILVHIPQRTS